MACAIQAFLNNPRRKDLRCPFNVESLPTTAREAAVILDHDKKPALSGFFMELRIASRVYCLHEHDPSLFLVCPAIINGKALGVQ